MLKYSKNLIIFTIQGAHTVYTSCGFQSNLQVQSSLARAGTVESEVATNSRTLHTLTVNGNHTSRAMTGFLV
jgi:hypothetical protein